MAWKAQFDAERLGNRKIIEVGEKRLTGKELFLSNAAMNDSDIQFVGEAPEESVEVDESLFDDLDLDADEFESDSEDTS